MCHGSTGNIARSYDQVGGIVLQEGEHVGQDALVMLKVCVNHREVGCASAQHAFCHGGREAPTPDAMDEADARVAVGETDQHLKRPIRGIVVHENYLERDVGERFPHSFGDERYVIPLIERGYDD